MAKSVSKLRVKAYSVSRRAIAVVEVLVSIAVLSVVLGLAAKMAVATSRVRNGVERHRVALEAKTNLMALAMAIPFEELQPETFETLANEIDPALDWKLSVQEIPAEVGATGAVAKRIRIGLAEGKKNARKNVGRQLVAWRYPSTFSQNDSANGGGATE